MLRVVLEFPAFCHIVSLKKKQLRQWDVAFFFCLLAVLKKTLWLLPARRSFLLGPPLSCARPPTWWLRPRLSETAAGRGRGLRSRRRWWQWESAGRPARTASLRRSHDEPQLPPWNLAGASRLHHGWIHHRTRPSCIGSCSTRSAAVPMRVLHWLPQLWLSSSEQQILAAFWGTAQNNYSAGKRNSFPSIVPLHQPRCSFLLWQEPGLNISPLTPSSLVSNFINYVLSPSHSRT